jgi:uncharacterized protein (UPF0548 family)
VTTRAGFPLGSPAGYRTLERSLILGFGAEVFERAVHGLLSWQMHLEAGISVDSAAPTATVGEAVLLTLGRRPFTTTAPCRVVAVLDEPDRRGFAYGTLPGHPESGEESFIVSRPVDRAVEPEDEDVPVTFTVRAFSRPARPLARLGGPVTRLVQRLVTERYLDALRTIALDDDPAEPLAHG